MIARVKYRALRRRELRASQVMAVSRSGAKINGSDPPLPAVCPARGRAWAQERLPAEVRQHLLNAIYSGQPFRTVLRDLGLTSNQVWGLTRTDHEWSDKLEVALMATRRDDLRTAPTRLTSRPACAASAGSTSASGWRGVVSRLPTLTRAATRLVKKDDHLRPIEKARRGRGD